MIKKNARVIYEFLKHEKLKTDTKIYKNKT